MMTRGWRTLALAAAGPAVDGEFFGAAQPVPLLNWRVNDFDGAFQFCRVLQHGPNGDGGDWQVVSPRRFKPDDADVGADQDADQQAAGRRAGP
jgi:hypothetical protein